MKCMDELALFTNTFDINFNNLYTINKKKYSFCDKHQDISKFYCFDCCMNFCSQCLLNGNNSKNCHNEKHKVCLTKDVANKIYNDLFFLLQELNDYSQYFNGTFEKLLQNKIDSLIKLKNEQVSFFSNIALSLEKRYSNLINDLMNIKNNLPTQKSHLIYLTQQTQLTFKKCCNYLYTCKDLINLNKEIELQMSKFQNNISIKFNLLNCVMTPLSIKINKAKFSFTIPNFKYIYNQRFIMLNSHDSNVNKKILYSPEFKINFLSWQVIVYPFGLNKQTEKYMSVFLWLKDGESNNVYNYNYEFECVNKIGFMNFKSPQKCAGFTVKGKVQGFNEFLPLSKIDKGEMINANGGMTFNVYLWPQSENEYLAELNNYINNLKNDMKIDDDNNNYNTQQIENENENNNKDNYIELSSDQSYDFIDINT